MARAKKRDRNIYVVELDPRVLRDKKFVAQNPGYVHGKPCVYVGMTSLSPEERFKQHKAGIKSARLVRKFGLRLKPRLYRGHNPMTYDEASEMEREKARRLRNRGYGVWQN